MRLGRERSNLLRLVRLLLLLPGLFTGSDDLTLRCLRALFSTRRQFAFSSGVQKEMSESESSSDEQLSGQVCSWGSLAEDTVPASDIERKKFGLVLPQAFSDVTFAGGLLLLP